MAMLRNTACLPFLLAAASLADASPSIPDFRPVVDYPVLVVSTKKATLSITVTYENVGVAGRMTSAQLRPGQKDGMVFGQVLGGSCFDAETPAGGSCELHLSFDNIGVWLKHELEVDGGAQRRALGIWTGGKGVAGPFTFGRSIGDPCPVTGRPLPVLATTYHGASREMPAIPNLSVAHCSKWEPDAAGKMICAKGGRHSADLASYTFTPEGWRLLRYTPHAITPTVTCRGGEIVDVKYRW